jgi:Predicted transcriptional regulators
MAILEKIKELDVVRDYTKQERIIEGVHNAIIESLYQHGDVLPSVNELAGQLGFSRETVVKAYKVLKERGIINSKPGVGYFISSIDTNQEMNIALVLYSFQSFQQQFYNTFRKTIASRCNIDVFFHHNNEGIYTTLINQIKGKYGLYIVAPIEDADGQSLLGGIQGDKLLIVDRYQYINDDVSYVTQEFEASFLSVLDRIKDRLNAYRKVVLYFDKESDYPPSILSAFLKFVRTNQINFEIVNEYESGSVEEQVAYITVGDNDLWELLKDCKAQNLELGDDVGVMSHNDSAVKEIIAGGITTFSTDFKKMAEEAANYVFDRRSIHKIIPTYLIPRGSL